MKKPSHFRRKVFRELTQQNLFKKSGKHARKIHDKNQLIIKKEKRN